jgi:ABC-type polysaccharide/polyol phosphate export permease
MKKTIINANNNRIDLGEIFRHKFILERIFIRDVKSVVGSTIGDYITLILKPIFLASIIGFIKANGNQNSIFESFVIAYFGLLLWWIFSENTKASISIFKRNRAIITKIYIPKIIFILTMFGSRIYAIFVQFGIGAILVILFERKSFDHFGLAASFLALVLLLIFSLNISIGLSVLALKYKVIRTLAEFMLFSMFFTMPIVFDENILGNNVGIYYALNPIGSAIAIMKNFIIAKDFNLIAPLFSLLFWSTISLYCINYFQNNAEQTIERI